MFRTCFLFFLCIQHINSANQAVDLFSGKYSLPHLAPGSDKADLRVVVRPVGVEDSLHARIFGNNLHRAGYHLRCGPVIFGQADDIKV